MLEEKSFFSRFFVLFGLYLFLRNQVFLSLKTLAMRSILERKQFFWVPDAALGRVWTILIVLGRSALLQILSGRHPCASRFLICFSKFNTNALL